MPHGNKYGSTLELLGIIIESCSKIESCLIEILDSNIEKDEELFKSLNDRLKKVEAMLQKSFVESQEVLRGS